MNTIAAHLFQLKQQITAFEKQYHRPLHSVALLAVSKKQSIEKIQQAYQAGQIAFGESYLQEALEKITALKDYRIEWHFIGPLQTNKTKKIAEHFAWVHSVDSIKLAKRLNEQRPVHLPPLNICIQVNTSEEASKAGIALDAVEPLAAYCLALPRLRLRGLMSIPALCYDFAEQRLALKPLVKKWQELNQSGFTLDTLSMGMSADMEAAIAEGSTLVRVGTAIFGKR